jgi:hypothetical protein
MASTGSRRPLDASRLPRRVSSADGTRWAVRIAPERVSSLALGYRS